MKKLPFLLTILPICIFAQDLPSVDYHIHVFSDKLLSHFAERGIKIQGGTFEVGCQNEACSNLDTIRKSSTDKLVLLSGSYAYEIETMDCSPEEYEKIVQAENDFVQKIVYSDRENRYGLSGINPKWNFASREVIRTLKELKLDGIKMHLQGNQIDIDEPELRDSLKNIFKILSVNDKIALIHLNGSDVNSGTELARSFITNYLLNEDKQKIVFAHAAGPGGVYPFTLDMLSEFELFMKSNDYAKHKLLYFEISGVLLSFRYPGKVDHKVFYEKMKSIGEDRFLFGSDYPFRTSASYLDQIKAEMEHNNINLDSILTRNIFEN